MNVIDGVLLGGWIAFWLAWVLAAFAARSARPGRTRWGRFAGSRVVLVLLVLLLLRLRVFGKYEVSTDPWSGGIGLAIFVLGLALAIWARVVIGRNWGMPMTERADPDLVRTGPYRTIRHPIYTGIIVAVIGTAIAVSFYWLIAAVVLCGYFLYSATMEERYLVKILPDDYPEYQRSTKMLIPFIF